MPGQNIGIPVKKDYQVVISQQAADQIQDYFDKIKAQSIIPGKRLSEQLRGKDLSQLSLENFLDILYATLEPMIFAESDTRAVRDWTPQEVHLLGRIGVCVPVTFFAEGAHERTVTIANPYEGFLLFTPGALLTGLNPADILHITDAEGNLDTEKFADFYIDRLYPLFKELNQQMGSRYPSQKTLVTIPGLGCGQFAPRSARGKLGQYFNYALKTFLSRYGKELTNIGAVAFTPHNEENCNPEAVSISNIDFICSPSNLTRGMYSPTELYGPKYRGWIVSSVVAADPLSFKGNDWLNLMRSTNEGKTADTDAASKTLGYSGQFQLPENLPTGLTPGFYPNVPSTDRFYTWREIIIENQLTTQISSFLQTYLIPAVDQLQVKSPPPSIKLFIGKPASQPTPLPAPATPQSPASLGPAAVVQTAENASSPPGLTKPRSERTPRGHVVPVKRKKPYPPTSTTPIASPSGAAPLPQNPVVPPTSTSPSLILPVQTAPSPAVPSAAVQSIDITPRLQAPASNSSRDVSFYFRDILSSDAKTKWEMTQKYIEDIKSNDFKGLKFSTSMRQDEIVYFITGPDPQITLLFKNYISSLYKTPAMPTQTGTFKNRVEILEKIKAYLITRNQEGVGSTLLGGYDKTEKINAMETLQAVLQSNDLWQAIQEKLIKPDHSFLAILNQGRSKAIYQEAYQYFKEQLNSAHLEQLDLMVGAQLELAKSRGFTFTRLWTALFGKAKQDAAKKCIQNIKASLRDPSAGNFEPSTLSQGAQATLSKDTGPLSQGHRSNLREDVTPQSHKP